jgi:Rrf2 family protein
MTKGFNISEAASIAIHSMVLIASADERLNSELIAEKLHSSKNHVAKVLQILVKNNFLSSVRGPKGGFVLSRPSENITLMEVYELFDGKYSDNTCGVESGACPFETCIYGGLNDTINREFRNYFENKKISDLVKLPAMV